MIDIQITIDNNGVKSTETRRFSSLEDLQATDYEVLGRTIVELAEQTGEDDVAF